MNKFGPQFVKFGKNFLIDKNKIIACVTRGPNTWGEYFVTIYTKDNNKFDTDMIPFDGQEDFYKDVQKFVDSHQSKEKVLNSKGVLDKSPIMINNPKQDIIVKEDTIPKIEEKKDTIPKIEEKKVEQPKIKSDQNKKEDKVKNNYPKYESFKLG